MPGCPPAAHPRAHASKRCCKGRRRRSRSRSPRRDSAFCNVVLRERRASNDPAPSTQIIPGHPSSCCAALADDDLHGQADLQSTMGGQHMLASRRRVLTGAASLALTAASAPALAAMGPDDKFDLVIKGGEVLDPSQSLRGRRDIGIRYGVIEAVEPDIPATRALRTIDAAGKLVTPGLVDLHCHVYPYGSAIGIPADELIALQCTTTCVSAGDAGANNFAGFRRFIVAQTRTRLYAFVHIANIGLTPFPLPELYNIDYAQVDACAKTVAENADIAIGVKVRMSENVIARNGAEPLKRAIAACEMAGTGGRVMAHIGGVENVALMVEILDLLRPGDILTHAYSGAPNLAGAFTNIVQDGR